MSQLLTCGSSEAARSGPRCLGCLLLLLLMAIPAGVRGQSIHGGITGGWGWATTSNEHNGNGPWRGGHVVGLVARATITDFLAFQVEAQEVERGFATRGSAVGLQQRFVEVPILLVASLPAYQGKVNPEIIVGVAPARERSCEAWATPASIGFGIPPAQQAEPVRCSHFRNQVRDLAGVVGGGASVEWGGALVSMSARLYRGTMTTWVSDLIPNEYNRGVVVGISAMIPLWARER
jgi:hypothetical protein